MSAKRTNTAFGASQYDPLTNLPNRSFFLDRLSQSLRRIHRNPNRAFAVLFIDLDRFRLVNEGLSHVVGDKILREVGCRLQKCLRSVDTVARVGGDEYAILLDELGDPINAIHVVDRIQKAFLPPMRIVGYETAASTSIGIVIGSPLYIRAEDVVRDAEIAMERARKQGRGKFAIFDTKMQEIVANRLSLELDLQKAVHKGQFRIHYQPIVFLETGKIMGFEALLRWCHPTRGLLQPIDFIPLAEETNLILPISYWVLKEACRQLADWQTTSSPDDTLCVSVNLPSKVLEDPSLPDEIAAAVSPDGITPSNLIVEITESQITNNPELLEEVLTKLSAEGIRIAIDDFGKGYTSLSYLGTLPAQILKIDQHFIAKLCACEKNNAIVRAVLSLGEALNLEVIAEGVEQEDQAECLRALKCKYAQGYYFARPMEAQPAESFISYHTSS